jgi:tetratricopeptide (TPR) repeat protein
VIDAGPAAVERVFVDRESPRTAAAEWLAAALPQCAWSCHLVVAAPDDDGALLEAALDHLRREPLATLHLHQLVEDAWGEPSAALERLMTAAEGFQREAYRERCGSRLIPLPILTVPPGADPRPQLEAARGLAERLAKPSLLLSEAPSGAVAAEGAAAGLRLYLGPPEGASALEVLTASHVLDSALDRLAGGAPLLAPCRPHLVVAGGRVHSCARQWALGVATGRIDEAASVAWAPDPELCRGCLADAVAGSTGALTANLRRPEGRELALRVSAALAESGEPGPAAALARAAAELADDGRRRAEARIQEGLCRLAEGRLAVADEVFVAAAGDGAARGDVAVHRARVQVAWRDDIEALDRYAEALAVGTGLLSTEQLHMEMALSHVRLEEWDDARAHLLQAGGPLAGVAFNLGVCDLYQGRSADALTHFDDALALGPAADELGRVHFFRGFCLKELERFDEAVIDLERSIGLEQAELAHHNLLGFCLYKLGRHGEAVASFERAVELDPGSAVDWANLGVNLERSGEHERAAAMYRRALRLDPHLDFATAALERLSTPG